MANLSANVTEYAPPYAATTTTISAGVSLPDALTLDGGGNLFIVNEGNNTVTEYAPPYTGSPSATIATDVSDPVALLLTP